MASESKTTIWFALVANGLIAVAKLAGGLIGGSSALLAEAAHSLADTTNQVLLLVSIELGSARPDEEHPYGHGKERFFWAFVVAVSIFVAGGIFSIAEGIYSLLQPTRHERFLVTLGVLLFALVAESIALARVVHHLRSEARHEKESFFTYVRQSKDPTPKVVLFEDSAAVTGVVIALAGVLVAHATGSHIWDATAAMAIGVLLIATGFELGRETKGLLIGEAARPEDRRAIREAVESQQHVKELVELLTMHIGPQSILVNARIALAPGTRADDIDEVLADVSERARRAVPEIAEIFIQPAPHSR